jgi:hypothetical protein
MNDGNVVGRVHLQDGQRIQELFGERDHEPRPARRAEPDLEQDVSHLPAFLLRPISIKA